jgi:hypothetical protein
MRRGIVVLVAGFLLPSCASPHIEAQTPAGIEIDCFGGLTCSQSPQALADLAQAHCRKYGLNAQQDRLNTSASGRRWVTYKCVAAGAM